MLLIFHGNTRDLLRRPHSGSGEVSYPLERRASIKDIVESLGIPHTEVGRIVLGQREKTFAYIPASGDRLDIYPQSGVTLPTRATTLRPSPLGSLKFMVDINVGKLAQILRMAGLDAAGVPDAVPRRIVETAVEQQRILLSRNRELLKHSLLEFGHLIREEIPDDQFREVILLYNLIPLLRPFSLCLRCNSPLIPVAKEAIIDRLKPLTKKYYSGFKQCRDCSRIYWKGSHHQHMLTTLERISA